MHLYTTVKNIVFFNLLIIYSACNFSEHSKTPGSSSDTIQQSSSAKEISQKIESDPKNAELYYQRSQIYFNEKYLNRAEADMETAIRLDSTNALYHYNMGRVQYAMNKTQAAANQYEKAITLKPDFDVAKLKLADLYFLVKEHSKSIDLLNSAMKTDKGNGAIYHMLGLNYKETGDTPRAIYHFQTAVEMDPTDYESTLYIANLYAAKRKEIAFEYYNAALKLRPKSVEALFARGVFAQNMKMYKQALMDYRRVINIDLNHYLSYYNVGYINYESKFYKEAIRNWDICTRMNPEFANAYYMKGLAYDQIGKIEDAKVSYQYALELEPQNELFKKAVRPSK